MALDHPHKISRLVLLDIVPTRTVFGTIDQRAAISDFHWFFLVQPHALPERLIAGNSDFYLDWILKHWCGTHAALTDEAVAAYRRCFDLDTIRATCEDYRAGATIDLVHDASDQEKRISCPLLLLWSASGTGSMYDVIDVWKQQASDVRGVAFDCGHFLAEERPEQTARNNQLSGRPEYLTNERLRKHAPDDQTWSYARLSVATSNFFILRNACVTVSKD
jgi:haloacetate dehalogenase